MEFQTWRDFFFFPCTSECETSDLSNIQPGQFHKSPITQDYPWELFASIYANFIQIEVFVSLRKRAENESQKRLHD